MRKSSKSKIQKRPRGLKQTHQIQIRSTKSETNRSQINPNPKKIQNAESKSCLKFCTFWSFEFVSDFDIRISDFRVLARQIVLIRFVKNLIPQTREEINMARIGHIALLTKEHPETRSVLQGLFRSQRELPAAVSRLETAARSILPTAISIWRFYLRARRDLSFRHASGRRQGRHANRACRRRHRRHGESSQRWDASPETFVLGSGGDSVDLSPGWNR